MKLIMLLLLCLVLSACSMGLQGDNGLTVAGNGTSNTVILALDGTVAREIGTDDGMAVPGSNTLWILGSGNITTVGSGNTVTISFEGGSGTVGPEGPQGPAGVIGNLTDSHILVGNSTNQPADVALSGDATINDLGEIDVAWADECQAADTANSATDSDKLDGLHGSSYLLGNATAADSTLFAGLSASQWTTLMNTYALSAVESIDFISSSGTAHPTPDGNISIIGGSGISTSASGSTVTIVGPGLSSCSVWGNATQSFAADTWVTVAHNNECFDINGEFDTTTYRFTAKAAGIYLVSASVVVSTTSALVSICLHSVWVNGAEYANSRCYFYGSTAELVSNPVTCLVSLAVGGYVEDRIMLGRNGARGGGKTTDYMNIVRVG